MLTISTSRLLIIDAARSIAIDRSIHIQEEVMMQVFLEIEISLGIKLYFPSYVLFHDILKYFPAIYLKLHENMVT